MGKALLIGYHAFIQGKRSVPHRAATVMSSERGRSAVRLRCCRHQNEDGPPHDCQTAGASIAVVVIAGILPIDGGCGFDWESQGICRTELARGAVCYSAAHAPEVSGEASTAVLQVFQPSKGGQGGGGGKPASPPIYRRACNLSRPVPSISMFINV